MPHLPFHRKEGMPDTNIVPLVPAGKIRCFITGKLRKDTPEENVRQRWARSLVEEYKYDKRDIALEFRIKMGRKPNRADIVVFKQDVQKKQENIFIIVEAKRENISKREAKEGIEQLKSYMAASSTCRYGLWVAAERIGFEKSTNGSIEEGLADIPSCGDLETKVLVFSDLVPALDLKATFRRCHNYVYVNQGLQKAEAFHEMLKLIFCKVYDETESSGELAFYIRNEERRSESGQRRVVTDRINPLFAAVKKRYPYIFKRNETIDLNQRVLSYIVSELQRVSLLQTKTDVKGSAYEELVGANLRGDRGEFFTPRNVCDMAVRMVVSMFSPNRLTSLQIVDPCCGTGGFLVSYINHLRQSLLNSERSKRGKGASVEEIVSSRIKEVCVQNIYGLDINPFLVRTCQMNLVMHGDGSANIFQANSAWAPSEWNDAGAAKCIPFGKADIVFTNPPFGGKAMIDDPHVLARYELAQFDSKSIRNVLPAEQLFVEASLNFLKPGGLLAIVLPDSILNNPGLEFIRKWLLRRVKIVASVDLPKETFATSGGVPNPSVLVVQKMTKTERKLAEAGSLGPYQVFMAIPKTAGMNKRGNPIYVRSPEGFEILDDLMDPIVDDEVSLVADSFADWISHGTT